MFEDFESDFDEDEDEDFELTELEEWYNNYFYFFKRPNRESPKFIDDVPIDIELFYEGTYKPVKQAIEIEVRKLARKQFPLIKEDNRPKILAYIDSTIENIGIRLLLDLWILIQDHKDGINLREKYPDLDSWVSFYARPTEAPVIDYSFADRIPIIRQNLDEKAIQEIAEENFIQDMEVFNYQEGRKKEYYDVIQPIILENFKDLDDFKYEDWVMYAVIFREEYETYVMQFEHVEAAIEYGLDEEDIDLDYKQFLEKLSIKMKEREKNDQETA